MSDDSPTLSSFATLFARPDAKGKLAVPERQLLQWTDGLLRAEVSGAQKSDFLNAIAEKFGAAGFADQLYREIFDLFIAHGVSAHSIAPANDDENRAFLLENAADLLTGLQKIVKDVIADAPRRLSPEAKKIAETLPKTRDLDAISAAIAAHDRFSRCRTFRFDGDQLVEAELGSAKKITSFYGFAGVRAIIADHLADFRQGLVNVPLLIYSLPGYGKTSMTISYALADSDDVLVLAGPEALADAWEKLYALVAARPDRRFILFFDDIEPQNVDWYNFRTHVGGAYTLAKHVLVILASNYEFPASILSRGRSVTFPVFDELRCTEMIEDFLRDFGLKRPPENLVALLGADYTEAFGQKKFTELSPRTLMRHLLVYTQSREKRRLLADLSEGEVITRPDPTLFYEFNIELMRTLYGDHYIERLREEKLRNLK